ncbi:MAG: flagellar hook capping protein [Leptospiraceae bacterium]|nr:flagellar hook capping protein [Leptospiraceae bacterium]MCK6380749.1 flagellar hook capping protein [Leptospiraceae bacterium]NUM42319.1 flagellar hook capping protein [Leptospiraceae bacterium]
MPDIQTTQNSEAARARYLDSDKRFDLKKHLENLDKEEKGGLKGIEIRSGQKQLGKDDFLKLLITQLSHQDPTSPVKDQDFIAQMAQFSSLEQMKNISSGISKMESRQSYSLVGKIVSGPDFVNGESIVGIAGALFFDSDGKTFVRVNGKTIDVNQITLISDPAILNKEEKPVSVSFPKSDKHDPKSPNVQTQGREKTEVMKEDAKVNEANESSNNLKEKTLEDWNFPGKNNSSGKIYE